MEPDKILSITEKMTYKELIAVERILNAEITSAKERLSCVENELFYRRNPECRGMKS